jgi:hypothetical protein
MTDDKASAEDWVWEKIRAGEVADFNTEFGKLDPGKPDGWNNDRKIGAKFLRRIFFEKPYQNEIPIEGVRIVGAFLPEGQLLQSGSVNRDIWLHQCRSENCIDFKSTTFDGSLSIEGSWLGQFAASPSVKLNLAHIGKRLSLNDTTFTGDVELVAAKIDGPLGVYGATFEKTLNGNGLQVGRSLFMSEKVTFNGDANLVAAKIGGQLKMDGATFEKTLNGNGLQVGQLLSMEKATFKGDVNLVAANIDGQLAMEGATFEKTLNGNGLRVSRDLLMTKATFKDDVDLVAAKIDGVLVMESATFEKKLNGNSLQVGQSLFMRGKATFKGDVSIGNAKIDGQLSLINSTFEATLDGQGVVVGQNLFMRSAIFKSPVSLPLARVGGALDLRGATLAGLDLTGAKVTQDLLLESRSAVTWSQPHLGMPLLTLRNTQVGAFQDSPRAWPSVIVLEGFSYSHLGGFGAAGTDDARIRSVKAWKSWLAKDGGPDRRYSPQPYAQLASVLVAAGGRDYANAILFAGRERERKQARRDHRSRRWLWLTALSWLCGYGIGIRTFRVLPWILGSVAVGTAVLWFCAPVATHQKGLLWCAGASLDRLLPIIQLNKEFGDFFNDPERKRLTGAVIAFFACLGLWGWVLGSFLIAAVSGLTQRS